MTSSRIAAIAAIVVGVIALAVVAFGGGTTHRYALIFENAGGLIRGNLVTVAGQQMGTVTDIVVTDDVNARVEIEVNELGPLRKGTTAQIRATSLGGVANKYIALSLGANNAPALKDGATIGLDDTRGITGQDEFVNVFDAETRQGLKDFVRGSAQMFDGRGEDFQTALDNSPGALKELKEFSAGIDPGDGSLSQLIVNFAAINEELASRAESISSLTRNAGIAGRAAAADGNELARAIASAPAAIDEANATLDKLPGTLAAVKTLMRETDRNDDGVPEMLGQLSSTLTDGQTTIAALARTLNRKGADNDAADLLGSSVALGDASDRAAKSFPAGLAAATPLLAKARAYTPDVISALTSLGQVAANYDGAGHYLRLAPVLNVFELSGNGPDRDLVPRGSFLDRLQGFAAAGNRCPGSAAQAPADGSAPFTDGGNIFCDPSSVPPGP